MKCTDSEGNPAACTVSPFDIVRALKEAEELANPARPTEIKKTDFDIEGFKRSLELSVERANSPPPAYSSSHDPRFSTLIEFGFWMALVLVVALVGRWGYFRGGDWMRTIGSVKVGKTSSSIRQAYQEEREKVRRPEVG